MLQLDQNDKNYGDKTICFCNGCNYKILSAIYPSKTQTINF